MDEPKKPRRRPRARKEVEAEAPAIEAAADYVIHTSPEMDALGRAAADGKHGRNYRIDDQAATRVHSVPGSSHYVQLSLTPQEESAGLTVKALEQLTREQDADAALAFLYISRVLAPPSPLPAREYAGGVIDFDDVISKIGWDPRSTEERREMHRRIYHFVMFGERAQVIGARRGRYKDKHSGREINTVIRQAPWRIHSTEAPDQPSLFTSEEIPVRVEIVMSREWTELLTSPQFAQYLPLGESLGAIPGNKPSGAWARVIGLALANFWRRNPKAAFDGSIRPTRRELLDRFPPKTGTAESVLYGPHPWRAVEYWYGALKILVKSGFVAPTGEATHTAAEKRKATPRQEWQEDWLEEAIDIQPGEDMAHSLSVRALHAPEKPAPKTTKTKS